MRKCFPILLLACASWIQATVAMKVPFGNRQDLSKSLRILQEGHVPGV